VRALALAILTACGASHDAPDAPAPDAPDVCDPSPRSVAPQAFIGPTGLQARLAALIDSAQTTLDVQMYLFTVTALAQRVVAARARGVAVRVILDPDEAGNDMVRPTFTAGGVPVRDASTVYPFSHAKYLVIDGTTAVIMSMNFNSDAMTKERNYGFVDTDAHDVADTQHIFNMDWALAGKEPAMTADLTCTRLVVAPVNAEGKLLAHVTSATTTLEVEALYVTEISLRNAIGAAADRGVAVRVILEDPSDQPQNADTRTYLEGKSIPVHYALNQFYLHAKLIIADAVAFVGSENFSSTGLQQNREVGGLLVEPTAAMVESSQFELDWTATNGT
jgi:phosphatidylserine/phosphatidylglycerophosphate/cardiolipin synthase-like enzyme